MFLLSWSVSVLIVAMFCSYKILFLSMFWYVKLWIVSWCSSLQSAECGNILPVKLVNVSIFWSVILLIVSMFCSLKLLNKPRSCLSAQETALQSWRAERSNVAVPRCTWRRSMVLAITWWWWKTRNAILQMSTTSSLNMFLLPNLKAILVRILANSAQLR